MKSLVFLWLFVLSANGTALSEEWKETQQLRLMEISKLTDDRKLSGFHEMLLGLSVSDLSGQQDGDREKIQKEVCRQVLSTPGYGAFYENELRTLSRKMTLVNRSLNHEFEGNPCNEISFETYESMAKLLRILEILPGPETVKLLCDLLCDPVYFCVKNEKRHDGFSISNRTGEILASLSLVDAPVAPYSSLARRQGQIVFPLDEWIKWCEEVKNGGRSFAFRGQKTSYRFLQNGKIEEVPRDPSEDDVRMFLGGIDPVTDPFAAGSLLKVIPLQQVPRRISYQNGDVSLVPDPQDERDGYMVIYLINDTEHSIGKVVGQNQQVSSEVLVGGRWRAREWIRSGCGNVPDPTDLPPRHALAISATVASAGDMGGTIRYRLSKQGLNIFSQTLRGRYDLKTCEEIHERTHLSMVKGPWNAERESIEDNWNGTSVAKTHEEFIALLDLSRHLGSLPGKDLLHLQRWARERLGGTSSNEEERFFCLHLEEVLTRPWLPEYDPTQLLERCVRALEYDGESLYGTPERCPALTLRYLFERIRWLRDMDGVEPRHSLPEDTLARLEKCLQYLMESDESAVRIAAAEMISRGPVKVGGAEVFQEMLEKASDAPVVVSALNGLAIRGEAMEALKWLAGNLDRPEVNAASCYTVISPYLRGNFSQEENSVILRIIGSQPLELPRAILRRKRETQSYPFPEEYLPLFRRFLWTEMGEGRKKKWSVDDLTEIRYMTDSESPALKLAECVTLQADFGKEEDDALLFEALDHPAAKANYWLTEIDFPVRSAAASALKRRGMSIQRNLVTELKIQPDHLSKRKSTFSEYWMQGKLIIGGIAFIIMSLLAIFLKKRAKQIY